MDGGNAKEQSVNDWIKKPVHWEDERQKTVYVNTFNE